jgi:D-glycero-D-manno-heptose 1,7-bisphosphate phosphatase
VRAAVFLDRDGVLNALVPDPLSGDPESPLQPTDVVLLPGAAEATRRLRDAGYVIVGVSNQPAAAKDLVALATLERVQARVLELLAREGVAFDDFRVCLHHPDAVVPHLAGPCDCRKPAPGMLVQAAASLGIDLRASWMIGDADTDIAAGAAAGCRTILLEHRASAHKRAGAALPDATAPDLLSACQQLLGHR